MKTNLLIIIMTFILIGCASIKANKDLNEKPENLKRGNPDNTRIVREYLQMVLTKPGEYEIKAYKRKAYSDKTKKNMFMFHCFYVFFYNGNMEHTLVFSATPKGSILKGCWMFDAGTDLDSYNLYINSDNSWGVEEIQGANGEKSLDTERTSQKIIERIDKNYKFFAGAIVKILPWYHQVWMFLVPPPMITYTPLLLMSINKDNCSTAVIETMVWKDNS